LDYELIISMIESGSSVLDLGCGDGELLSRLMVEKKARVQGIELDEQAIYKCVAKGLSVLHGDLDSGLSEYGDNAFDYVIINQTFQQVKNPDTVLEEAMRVGKYVIVGFPNFAHLSARLQLAVRGKSPVTPALPYEWFNTPNVHFLSISDFTHFCSSRNIHIKQNAFINKNRQVHVFPNLFADLAIFVIYL
jgi:methionine biosynthesis protein MetW